jgi:hypothetical protein
MSWDIPWDMVLYVTVIVLIITLAIDLWYPYFFREGFMVGSGDNAFMALYFPRRGDISFGTDESGFIQDKRHVMGYADIQGLGVPHDFCRMLIPKGMDDDRKFFACGLAGTENLSSTGFRTPSVKDGFKTSRDDYMRDVDNDGKTDYCAVIKVKTNTWESQCYRALETTFDTRTFTDTDPPEDIADILNFYEGILFWFRFIDDMKDYGENLKIYGSGGLQMDESDVKTLPSQNMSGDTTTLDDRIQITRGLQFNGSDQFLRLGDSPDMSFGQKINLTTMRAICFWVKFDKFTNNAHILDFGNGAGRDNVFVGIIGQGDEALDMAALSRKNACDKGDLNNVMPDFPTGAQPVPDLTPVKLMLSTSANVDDPPCETPILPRKLPPLKPLQADSSNLTKKATLIYEVWNGKLRMQHIKVPNAFTLKKWTHVCITTASGDGVRPPLQVWINGQNMAEDPSAHLPQTAFTTNNYFGKSNWSDASSTYENRPELFKGSLFDVRGYNQAVNGGKLMKTFFWGKKRLGIK